MNRLRTRFLATVLCLLLLADPLSATWSIIIVDTRTGEIAIGSATCLAGFDLRRASPVVLVGIGAAAAQAAIDLSGVNRQFIRTQLLMGTPPQQILALLPLHDPAHQTRQYGIVDVLGRAAAFTGAFNGAFASHLTGSMGTLAYSIQGNVLTGLPVLQMAEQALLNTPGDLAGKLMAAMQAARSMGGDGRCSCSVSNPTGCGSPPPFFLKSAHIGYMIVARQGDQDGPCGALTGCAAGSYYMNHNVAFQAISSPDPVLQLQQLFNTWRTQLLGRPDHNLSTVSFSVPSLPADGLTTALATLTLRDWTGAQLTGGGAVVAVALDATSTAGVQVGPVVDLGNGTYTFPVTAGTVPGTAELRITADDGQGAVLLSPRTPLVLSGDPLWASRENLSATLGANLSFVVHPGAAFALRDYILLVSNGGTTPGVLVAPGLHLPLNPDPLFFLAHQAAITGLLPGFFGTLDGTGRAGVSLSLPAGSLIPLQGSDLSFAFGLLSPIDFVSNPVSLSILP